MKIVGTTQCCDTIAEAASLTAAGGCIYCNPPAGISSLTEAMPEKYTTYEEYARDLFQYIDSMQPQTLYIEAGVTNRELLLQICRQYFQHVDIDECRAGYRTSRRRWIICCGREEQAPRPDRGNIGTKAFIRWLCRRDDIRDILHLYFTDGWLEFQAYKNEKKVLCISHNAEAAAERLQAMIEEHEKKKQKKEKQ